MRTEGLLKRWAFQKENDGKGEYYRCKISLSKSEGRLRIDPMTELIHGYLRHAKIETKLTPSDWKRVTDMRTRVPGGGPWTSRTEDPEKPISRKPKVIIKSAIPKGAMDLSGNPGTPMTNRSVISSRADETVDPTRTGYPANHELPTRNPKKIFISVKRKTIVVKETKEDITVRRYIRVDESLCEKYHLVQDKLNIKRMELRDQYRRLYPNYRPYWEDS